MTSGCERTTDGRARPGPGRGAARPRNADGAGHVARPVRSDVMSGIGYQVPEAGQAPLPTGAQVRVTPPPAALVIVYTPAVSDFDFAVIV